MSGDGAPESWDQDVASNQFSKLNVNATEFVPSWSLPSAPTTQTSKTFLTFFLTVKVSIFVLMFVNLEVLGVV